MNNLSNRIRIALAQKELKQTELASLVGVSTAAVNKWVKGNTKNLKNENLIAISQALGVSLEWLVSGEASKKISIFNKITLDDLYSLPPEYIEDIEDYIVMKIHKYKEIQINKKTA